MSINIKKGETVDLKQAAPSMHKISIGLGWEIKPEHQLDLDASMFMVGADGLLPNENYFVYYNNLESKDGAVVHTGDNDSGTGDGDDEMILADLSSISPDINELIIMVSIHHGTENGFSFGMLHDAYIRLCDMSDNTEILRYDLDEEYTNNTEVEFARFRRTPAGWSFTATGKGTNWGLEEYIKKF